MSARAVAGPVGCPAPITLYVFTMPGCSFCEQAKAEVVPKLLEAGVIAVVLDSTLADQTRCGFSPRSYPTFMFSRFGVKVAVVDALPARKPVEYLMKIWHELRGD